MLREVGQNLSTQSFQVAVALGLFVLTLGAWIIVHRGYSLLLPNPGRIKRYIMLAGNNEALEMTVKDAVEGMTRLRAPSGKTLTLVLRLRDLYFL